jgi:hypothetical protein
MQILIRDLTGYQPVHQASSLLVQFGKSTNSPAQWNMIAHSISAYILVPACSEKCFARVHDGLYTKMMSRYPQGLIFWKTAGPADLPTFLIGLSSQISLFW